MCHQLDQICLRMRSPTVMMRLVLVVSFAALVAHFGWECGCQPLLLCCTVAAAWLVFLSRLVAVFQCAVRSFQADMQLHAVATYVILQAVVART